jgi:multiple sugar transport system ATP-binding protein
MAQIVLDQVDKVYAGGVQAISELNLEIADGEFMVLVGPSGCGKSTALRMIAGLEEISDGTIQIGDQVVNELPPKDRDIAMVFQNYALYPHMTVRQNLAFGLQMRKVSKDEIGRRTQGVAKMLGLEQYLDRKPRVLSGGQRQRVAMGRAIVREPQAFLMDEPLSNLDAKLRVSMRASLAQLHDRLNVTTVYVTHDQTEAMTLGDRVCVLRDGMLQQVDTPQNLFNHPVNLFVAGFIGSPAMNITMARLDRDGGGGRDGGGSGSGRAGRDGGDSGSGRAGRDGGGVGEAGGGRDSRDSRDGGGRGGRDAGQAVVSFAGYQLPLPAEVIAGKPGIEKYFGRELILGIRPSDFEDAGLADPGWARMPVTADVTEELGSEILVMFLLDAPPVENRDTAALAADQYENEAGIPLAEGKTMWTARAGARSGISAGNQIELSVDTSNLYFFDPESGLAIGSQGNSDR